MNYMNKKKYKLSVITICILFITLFAMFLSCSERVILEQEVGIMKQIQRIFDNAYGYTVYEETYNDSPIYAVYDDDYRILGIVYTAVGNGYQGPMRILTGLENKEVIHAAYVIASNDELNAGNGDGGDPLDFSLLTEQVKGLPVSECMLSDDGGGVDGITRATRSSESFVGIIKSSASEIWDYLQ
jgi:Na+-translocating ferredoxin:NAD+ oxidoreductase RnfG subunit